MRCAFFYQERKGVFVVGALAIWFGLLGVFGPYLPANASKNSKHMTVKINGNDVVAHWTRENGSWKFQRVSEILKINRSPVRQAALARRVAGGNKTQSTTQIAGRSIARADNGVCVRTAASTTSQMSSLLMAPATTASVTPNRPKRIDKKAMRARLAEEIGRWARIGNRWQWQQSKQASTQAPRFEMGKTASDAQIESHQNEQQQARWIRRNGVWMFEAVKEQDLLIRI